MWYKEGTISVVQGSAGVTGVGTNFVSNTRTGDMFVGPDGKIYEVVNAHDQLTLGISPAYAGPSVSNTPTYYVVPVQGYVKLAVDRLHAIAEGIANIDADVAAAALSAAQAEASRLAAEVAEANAAASQGQASTAETNASASAASSLASATASQTSAEASAASAAQALSSANTATTQAGLAKTSADAMQAMAISPFIGPFTALGDGVTDDTAAFAAFEAIHRGRTVDLNNRTVLVTAIPSKNAYVNGRFKLGDFTKPAIEPNSFLADPVYYEHFGGQLAELRDMLLNPLAQFIGLVFIGDSQTWGSGTGESSTSDPRTGFLSDPRDFGGTPNVPNTFRDFILKSYGRGATVAFSNWPTAPTGQCIATITFAERIQTMWNGLFTIVPGGSNVSATEVFAASLPTGKRVNLSSGNVALETSHTVSWRFTGKSFRLFHSTVASTASNYEIFVNGVSLGVKSTAASDNPGWVEGGGNFHDWSFPFAVNALIELKTRRMGATGNRVVYLDGIGVTKVVRITNQGIIGASSDSYRIRNLVSADNMALRTDDKFAFVQMGTNDRIKGSIGGSENDIQIRYEAMLAAIPAGISKVLMCSSPAENEVPATYFTDMSEIRAMIIRVAKEQGFDFIDNYTALRRNDPRCWSNDGLHPNALGYTVVAKNIFNAIETSREVISKAQAATNASLVEVVATKVPKTDIIDNVTTDDATKVLSAKQGKFLYELLQSNNVSAVAYKFITTAGQTTLTGLDSGGKNLVYTPGAVMLVTGQGFDYWDGYDYTATDGTSIVFTEAFVAGEEIGVVVFGTFSLADHYTKAEDDAKFVTKTAVIDLAHGGTGATTAAAARTALGLGSAAVAPIVGTVSQTGGIPTGSIIESGSNTNGSYTKYADGTMICRNTVDLGSIAVTQVINSPMHASAVVPGKTFAMPFTVFPNCHLQVISSTATAYVGTPGLPSLSTSQSFYIIAPTANNISCTIVITAIGRWF